MLTRDRYAEICNIAVGQLEEVFTQDQANQFSLDGQWYGSMGWYEPYINAKLKLGEPGFGAPEVKRLIERICENLDYKVEFWPYTGIAGSLKPPQGFISWLMVRAKKKTLYVLYNLAEIKNLDFGQPGSPPAAVRDSVFSREKMLARVLLHECGHAVLHLGEIIKQFNRVSNPMPALDAYHEQEAWFYALAICGVLVGEHSYRSRKKAQPDQGFGLS